MNIRFEPVKNDISKAGKLAAKKIIFGPRGRYAIAPVHTRFDGLMVFVWDAETPDEETGLAAVIRMTDTVNQALDGLARQD